MWLQGRAFVEVVIVTVRLILHIRWTSLVQAFDGAGDESEVLDAA